MPWLSILLKAVLQDQILYVYKKKMGHRSCRGIETIMYLTYETTLSGNICKQLLYVLLEIWNMTFILQQNCNESQLQTK